MQSTRNVIQITSTMKNKAEFIGRPTVLMCSISVFIYTPGFADLVKTTEPKVDSSQLQQIAFRGV